MDELIEFVARHLVGNRDAVRITKRERGSVTIYELEVDQRDMGRVIGRQGRMATAVRTLMRAAPIARGKKCQLEIVEAS